MVSKVTLTVRIISQKKSFGEAFKDVRDYIEYCAFIFMDYYFKIQGVLNKHSVAYEENLSEFNDENLDGKVYPLHIEKKAGMRKLKYYFLQINKIYFKLQMSISFLSLAKSTIKKSYFTHCIHLSKRTRSSYAKIAALIIAHS